MNQPIENGRYCQLSRSSGWPGPQVTTGGPQLPSRANSGSRRGVGADRRHFRNQARRQRQRLELDPVRRRLPRRNGAGSVASLLVGRAGRAAGHSPRRHRRSQEHPHAAEHRDDRRGLANRTSTKRGENSVAWSHGRTGRPGQGIRGGIMRIHRRGVNAEACAANSQGGSCCDMGKYRNRSAGVSPAEKLRRVRSGANAAAPGSATPLAARNAVGEPPRPHRLLDMGDADVSLNIAWGYCEFPEQRYSDRRAGMPGAGRSPCRRGISVASDGCLRVSASRDARELARSINGPLTVCLFRRE